MFPGYLDSLVGFQMQMPTHTPLSVNKHAIRLPIRTLTSLASSLVTVTAAGFDSPHPLIYPPPLSPLWSLWAPVLRPLTFKLYSPHQTGLRDREQKKKETTKTLCEVVMILLLQKWNAYPRRSLNSMQPSENQSALLSYAVPFCRTSGAI